jgi:CheY-like chemotaxis protein
MMQQCQPELLYCTETMQQQQALHTAPILGGVVGLGNNHDFRILLIDDNRDAIDSMGALLSLLDYNVRTAEDAESGLEIAQDFEPHLILSDIGLPGMDGYALAPELRKAAGARKLILAAATSYGLASDKRRARDAGFDYHLVKPLDADLLISFVALQQNEF